MTTVSESLRAALADRYRIERELGRGGMATVYLAHDLRHDRPVAIKVLHPELTATLGPDRFLQEIRTTARLDHPHILALLDSGEAEGTLWYTMPYVEGESLRDRLRRESQLPIEHALRITGEVADALDYAHEQRVVHRDIKPENILLARGHARVADFGIARALEAAGGGQLTQTGMAVGTPTYMSPEQASGAAVDARSDIYALGCVLYEMLVGEPPFTGPTPQAVIARRFTETPRPLHATRDRVPPHIEDAVARALARTPADRFETAAEFARALEHGGATPAVGRPPDEKTPAALKPPDTHAQRRFRVSPALILGLGFVLGLGALFAWRRTLHDNSGEGATSQRLVVLPFRNLGGSENEYFADGLTEAITTRLGSLHHLRVIGQQSAMQYKGTEKAPSVIGRELGAQYLLTGTVRYEKPTSGPSRLRVSPSLIRAGDGTLLWAAQYDTVLAGVFEVQSLLAKQVAGALDIALGEPEQQALEARPTDNIHAYEAYLLGRQASDQAGDDPRGLHQAVSLLEQAVALDPKFALAYANLARVQLYMWFRYVDRDTLRVVAGKRAAEEALRLDPALPEAQLALGYYHYHGRLDYEPALEQFFQAERSQPSNPEPLAAIAYIRRRQGRWEEALDYFRRVQQMDPRAVTARSDLVDTYFILQRYREAIAWYDSTAAVATPPSSTRVLRALSYLGAGGSSTEFRRAFPGPEETPVLTGTFGALAGVCEVALMLPEDQQTRLLSVRPEAYYNDSTGLLLGKAVVYRARGDSARARAEFDAVRAVLERRLRRLPNDAVFHGQLGLALAGLGRAEEAVREGERGVALRPPSKDATEGPALVANLARIDLLTGRLESAIDQLEIVLSHPGPLSPAWLRVDPTFARLRGNPRFERLVNGS
ncbi:MAG: protein kinase domain-containing protein [Gemmatimonadales bacterium]